jgi:hypothetical protein
LSLDYGFRIFDFVCVGCCFVCFGYLVAERRRVGWVSRDSGFRIWIWDLVSVLSVVLSVFFRGHLFPCPPWSVLSVVISFRVFPGVPWLCLLKKIKGNYGEQGTTRKRMTTENTDENDHGKHVN